MEIKGTIVKRDDDKFLVYGWASVANDKDGNPVVDSQGDIISIQELEKAAFGFVRFNGTGAAMHQVMGVGTVVESIVFTPEKFRREKRFTKNFPPTLKRTSGDFFAENF